MTEVKHKLKPASVINEDKISLPRKIIFLPREMSFAVNLY